jgi:hypothetical protein
MQEITVWFTTFFSEQKKMMIVLDKQKRPFSAG